MNRIVVYIVVTYWLFFDESKGVFEFFIKR